MRRYVKFKTPYLPSFVFRVLHMTCSRKIILKSSLSQWSIWWEMGNRMIDMDFEFQTWHAMWNSRLHIFLLLTSGSSIWLLFERIFSNNHEIHDRYEKKWKNERSKGIFNFKRDMLCEVQGSISSFFWLQGPPDDLYSTEYYQIIIIIMMNVIRNGE